PRIPGWVRRARWADSSISPVSSTDNPPSAGGAADRWASTTTLPSLASPPAKSAGGHSTDRRQRPTASSSPACTVRSRAPARSKAAAASGASNPGGTTASATVRPRSTPLVPPAWSRSWWVSTSSATRRTRSRSKQRSTAPGRGPVSTTTASPRSTANTSASPWPTSQATTAHPGGGQLGARQARASAATADAAIPAATTLRAQPRSTSSAASRTASSNAPTTSDRHGTAPCGTRAPHSAMRWIQATATPGTHTATCAAGGATSPRAATTKPPTVATGTNGPAATFVGTDTQLTSADSTTSSGAHATWAASV